MGGAHIFLVNANALIVLQKIKFLYKTNLSGNTIIRKMNSTKGFIQIVLHI